MLRFGIFVSVSLLFVAVFCSSPRFTTVEHERQLTPVGFVAFAPSEDDKSEVAKKEFEALNAEFESAIKSLREEIAKLSTEEEKANYLVNNNPGLVYSEKFIGLAEKYPDTKTAVNSLLFAFGQSKGQLKNQAMTMLLEKYPGKVRLDKIAASFKQEVPSREIENWYLLMIKGATKDSIKASVVYDYSKYVGQIPTFKRTIEINPSVQKKLPKAQLEYIYADRTEEQSNQLAGFLQSVIDDQGELKRGRSTYGELAKRELYDLRYLQVGMEAPDIEGNDLDGIKFRLSDYRGKVVMLDFWGQWCPPCRAMYPREQELVRKLADLPFVLIGINSDQEFDTAKEAVRDEGLSWRHFWNGPKGTNGPIAKQWNVEGWPTFYLIDENGIIRYKEVLGKDIDRGIETLMAEMGYEINLLEEGVAN